MKYIFKTRPWPHQARGLRYVLREMGRTGSSGLYVPMRWGKSKVAIDVAGCLHIKHGIQRVLVVTTTSGIGVWHNQIKLHSPASSAGIEWMVVHHALLYGRDFEWGETAHEWTPGPNAAIEEFAPEFIIMDESHRVGNPSSMQCKMAYRYGKKARFRLILTGTPFHRAPMMIFGQFKFMDDSVFGTHITPFKRMYIRFGGYGNYQIKGYKNLKDLSRKVKRKVFIQEYVQHTKPVVRVTPVELEESRPVYRAMERKSFVNVRTEDITAPIILTKHLRCAQIAGGWVKAPTGRYLRVGSEKYRALGDKLAVDLGMT